MGEQKTTQDSSSQPWIFQAPYLMNAFNYAQNDYNNQMAQGSYKGNYIAPTNANQYNAANSQYNTAMGASTDNNQAIANQGYNLMGAGNGALSESLGGYSNFLANNTPTNLTNTANQIASGFNLQGQVDSAMQVANRNAAENTLPNLYRSAAGNGNLNSDRTALAQGVVQRGLQEQAGNLAAQFENQNLQTGLQQANTLSQQNLGALSNLGYLGQGIGQSGLNALSTNINNSGAIANQAQQGANEVQALDQSNLNNQIQQYQQNQNFPWQALQNYMSVVGGNNWGSQSHGTQTTTPSGLSIAGGVLGALGGLFG
jgi:hypothetical protein